MNEIPNGLGPWFCALLFNTSVQEKCKTQTYLAVHTFPHLYVDYLNSQAETDFWILVLQIGPFKKWQDARNFHAAWSTKTKSKTSRLERGLELFDAFQTRLNLSAWGEYQLRDACLAKYVKTQAQEPTVARLDNMASNYTSSLYGAEIYKYEYKKQKK
jgi:hypothetical protein